MIGDIVAAFTVGLLVAVVYYELTGCSNGHVWDDGTSRWEIVPFHSGDDYGVTEKVVYQCECDGCLGEKTERGDHFRVKRDDLEDCIDVLQEHKYK